MAKYSKKDHLEEFEFGLYRACEWVREQPSHAYPKELAKLEQALLDVSRAYDEIYDEIQEKYFRKDWDKESDED